MDPASAGMAAAIEETRIRNQGIDPTMGIFNSNYIYDMFYDELAEIQPTAANISREAFTLFQRAVDGAVSKLEEDLVRWR